MVSTVMTTTQQLIGVCMRLDNIERLLETDPHFRHYQQWRRILDDETFEAHSGRHTRLGQARLDVIAMSLTDGTAGKLTEAAALVWLLRQCARRSLGS